MPQPTPFLLSIAVRHLLARKRQSLVSMSGIVLGVGFFLAISSMMQGSQKDFIRRLVDNSPHITINDEFRNPRLQPAVERNPGALVEVKNVKPITETRGIRSYEQIMERLARIPGLRASPVQSEQALASFAGDDVGITMNGMIPEEITTISTIGKYMVKGSLESLIANPDGMVVGAELARRMSFDVGDNITIAATTGQVRTFKVLGLYRTGRSDYDVRQAFIALKRAQSLTNRPNRVNRIIIKLEDPNSAFQVANEIESWASYKTVSWQEASEDLLNTLVIRNIIMYSVVSAVLIVAAFGIYNVISTVVMEKHRDIAILKSMGFHARDIRRIFLFQGVLLGATGNLIGLPLGMLMMYALMQVRLKPPGSSEVISMPLDWGIVQFLIAGTFALCAAIAASYFPARKGAALQPVDVLRGGM